MKKIKIFILIFFITFIINGNVNASNNLNTTDNRFEVINDLTLKDIKNNYYYHFENHNDLKRFINNNVIKSNDTTMSTCLPGMPGYPNCHSNPIVSTGSRYLSHYNTDFIKSNELLLGNNGWVFGGRHGATMSFNTSMTVTFTHGSLSLSHEVGHSSTFNVPAGKRGNIKYQAKWRIETREGYSVRKDGSKTGFYKYKVTKFIEGGFIGVYK